ncbi:MAG: hypothetical protein GY750_00675 [Lentisphaerae bacterium]|nr:hypothetical protein [Lentisphaerota bacterium]MCP4099934.1 hypothetical protein [Lentisphaerota bacterium]
MIPDKIKNYFGNKTFLLVIITLGLVSFSANAEINVEKIVTGWTGSITFSSDQDVNLGKQALKFDLTSGITVNSVWGLDGKLSFSQTGQTVSVNVKQWWPEDSDYILTAGKTVTLSFSSSAEDYTISNIRTGDSIEQGTVNLAQSSSSLTIPENAEIKFTPQGSEGSEKTVKWSEGNNVSLQYGTYSVSASVKVNDQSEVISVSPAEITLNKSQATANVELNYTKNLKTITFTLPISAPDGITKNLNVTVKDLADNSETTVEVPWDSQAKLSNVKSGHSYAFSAIPVYSGQMQYNFTFTPDTVSVSDSTSSYSVSISANTEPVKQNAVYVTVSGLPEGESTTLSFTPKDSSMQTVKISNVVNGKNETPYYLYSGDYTLTALPVIVSDMQYTVNSQTVSIQEQEDNNFTASFAGNKITSLVPGWPAYIAMGAVTDSNYSQTSTFEGRPVDAIFKYAGDGGNGDPGRIVYPVYTKNTVKQANLLSTNFNANVKPVMVVYTAEMSGGTNFKDLENTGEYSDYLTKHFINLMLVSGLLQSYNTTDNPYPGSIVLNADLLGMVQQQKLWTADGTGPLNSYNIDVKNALQRAIWFMATQHNWTITRSYGDPVVVNSKSPLELIENIEDLKDQGVYSDWDIKSGWEEQASEILANAPDTSSIDTPSFGNSFKGWIEATNWVIKTYAPNITFGWQSNVWSGNSSNFVHNDMSTTEIVNNYSAPVADLWNALGVYNGTYKPDFVVFDKYEMDATAAYGIGYLWNQRDLDNYLIYVNGISTQLGNSPVMLWQIPGGHLQTVGEIDTRDNHGSTEPDYFFGSSNLKSDLSNVKSYFLNLVLQQGAYNFSGTAQEYLTRNDQDWTIGNLEKARESKVFSILWGGGQTTSVGTFPTDDGGWLAQKIINYYKSPTFLKK